MDTTSASEPELVKATQSEATQSEATLPEAAAVTDSDGDVVCSRTTGPAESSAHEALRPSESSIRVDLRADHRSLLRMVTSLVLVTLLVEWIFLTTQRPKPLTIERGSDFRDQFQVEINSATWVEWLQLEGIGPSLAHRIVADRKLNGPFASIDELSRVPGIGPATLDRIRRWLTIRYDHSDTNLSEALPNE